MNIKLPPQKNRKVGVLTWCGRLYHNHHLGSDTQIEVDFLKGCNMSYRRQALCPIDERFVGLVPYGFEIDLGLYARQRGWRIVYDPHILVDHYSPTSYRPDSVELSWALNHNQTYLLLKHLSWPRKLVFLIYTFCIGDRNTIGIIRVPYLLLRQRWSVAAFWPHFCGKFAGIRSYIMASKTL